MRKDTSTVAAALAKKDDAVEAVEAIDETPALAVSGQETEETTWSIVDGEWQKVSISDVVEPMDMEGYDRFAVPASLQAKHPEMEFMHGSENRDILRQLRQEGWLPLKSNVPGAEMKDGVPHLLGPDAPLMVRPKDVAPRYRKDTIDLMNDVDQALRDEMADDLKTWRKSDRNIDTNPDAYLSVRGKVEIEDRQGRDDREAQALLANARAQNPNFGREDRKSTFQIPMSDQLAASLRKANELRRQAAELEKGAMLAGA